MSGMNRSRLLLAGLIAGLVINVGEFLLNVPVAGASFEAALIAAGLPIATGSSIMVYVAMAFALGFAAVWTYAAIRERYGPGPTTAIRAGLLIWTVGFLLPTISLGMLGIFPMNLLLLAGAWTLVEIPLATVAGAWVYREAEAPVAVPAAARPPM
jgi:hypothetical protein